MTDSLLGKSMPHNARSLPAGWYVDPEIHKRELVHVFGGAWIYAAHRSEFMGEGASCIAREVLGKSLLFVHDGKGFIRCFYNKCRHRAMPLAGERECKALKNYIRCPYHGWRYTLDGYFRGAPLIFGGHECLNGEKPNLLEVPVKEWSGLLFVNLNGHAPPFSEWIYEIDTLAGHILFCNMQLYRSARYILRCNWKVYAENYLEGMHIPWVHPTLNKETDMKSYRVVVRDRIIEHVADMEEHSSMGGLWCYVWPNLAINYYGSGANIERFTPIGPQECLLEYTYLVADPRNESVNMKARHASEEVTREDIVVCELVQKNLAADPKFEQGFLSHRHENGVWAFQDMVRRSVAYETKP